MKTSHAAVAMTMLLTSCSIHHNVARDYPQYLANHVGQSHLPTTSAASAYAITPETTANHYQFRSVMAGYANVWVVRFGEILDDTMQSRDVQAAFNRLKQSKEDEPPGGLLIFDLEDYSYSNFGAHVALKVTYRRDGRNVFTKYYSADGRTEGGKMFWGGEFAMKNAVQQSTNLAIDDVLRRLISDLNSARMARATRRDPAPPAAYAVTSTGS